MSLSTRSYSKESRSSSYFSRSASHHSISKTNQNNSTSSLSRSRTLTDSRPLSTRLIERDSPLPWHWDLDDPFYFDRIRWRLDNGIWRWNWWPWEWSVPLTYRTWDSSTTKTRIIPVQYSSSSSSSVNRRPKSITNDSSSNVIRHDESSIIRENRISNDNYPPKQDPPTRRRTSMTIFVQRPYIDQTEVPYYRQTLPTSTYPQSTRFDYY